MKDKGQIKALLGMPGMTLEEERAKIAAQYEARHQAQNERKRDAKLVEMLNQLESDLKKDLPRPGRHGDNDGDDSRKHARANRDSVYKLPSLNSAVVGTTAASNAAMWRQKPRASVLAHLNAPPAQAALPPPPEVEDEKKTQDAGPAPKLNTRNMKNLRLAADRARTSDAERDTATAPAPSGAEAAPLSPTLTEPLAPSRGYSPEIFRREVRQLAMQFLRVQEMKLHATFERRFRELLGDQVIEAHSWYTSILPCAQLEEKQQKMLNTMAKHKAAALAELEVERERLKINDSQVMAAVSRLLREEMRGHTPPGNLDMMQRIEVALVEHPGKVALPAPGIPGRGTAPSNSLSSPRPLTTRTGILHTPLLFSPGAIGAPGTADGWSKRLEGEEEALFASLGWSQKPSRGGKKKAPGRPALSPPRNPASPAKLDLAANAARPKASAKHGVLRETRAQKLADEYRKARMSDAERAYEESVGPLGASGPLSDSLPPLPAAPGPAPPRPEEGAALPEIRNTSASSSQRKGTPSRVRFDDDEGGAAGAAVAGLGETDPPDGKQAEPPEGADSSDSDEGEDGEDEEGGLIRLIAEQAWERQKALMDKARAAATPTPPAAREQRWERHNSAYPGVRGRSRFKSFSSSASQMGEVPGPSVVSCSNFGDHAPENLCTELRRAVTNEEQHAGVERYETSCAELEVLPSSRVFEQLRHGYCDLSNCHLGRKGGEALAAPLRANTIVTHLNLTCCGLDTNAAREIVEALSHCPQIRHLNLSDNELGRAACISLGVLMQQRKDPTGKLERPKLPLISLTLNRCSLGNDGVAKVCEGLNVNYTLIDLFLQGNNITNIGGGALGKMLAMNTTLRTLDIGWNAIKGAGVHALIEGLYGNLSLETLLMPWNGLDTHGGSCIGDLLAQNRGLTTLDISSCRQGSDAAMCIADGLKVNNVLQALVMNDNPLGDDGGRHLMHALSVNTMLKTLGLQGCSFASSHSTATSTFDFRNPAGHYKLELSNPPERSIALQLIALGKVSPGSWTNVRLDSKIVRFDPVNLDWPDELPLVGMLELDYVMTLGPSKSAQAIDEPDLENMVEQLHNAKISDMERIGLLKMFSASHYFECRQVFKILQQFEMGAQERIEAAVMLFSRVIDSHNIDMFFPPHASHPKERLKFNQALGFVKCFQANNPTGHYELNLAVQVDRLIAYKLIESAAHEGEAYSNLRNICFQGKYYHAWSSTSDVVFKELPDNGYLRVDYLTFKRAVQPGDKAMSDDELRDLIRAKLLPVQSSDERVVNLRICSGSPRKFLVNCEQVRDIILPNFSLPEERVEVVVLCYNTLVDRENLWKILIKLRPLEQSYIANRMGYDICFNAKHPTQHYRLDLTDIKHYKIAKDICEWAAKEGELQNVYNMIISGRKPRGVLVEDSSLFSVLTNTVSGPTPLLEFDYAHAGTWFADMGIPIPSTVVKQQETMSAFYRRRALDRCCLMHAFWIEQMEWVVTPDPFHTDKEARTGEEGPGPSFTPAAPDPPEPKAEPSSPGKKGKGGKKDGKKDKSPQKGDKDKASTPAPPVQDAGVDKKGKLLVPAGSLLEQALNSTGARVLRPHHWQMGWDRLNRQVARLERSWIEDATATPLKMNFWMFLDKDDNGGITLEELRYGAKTVLGLSGADKEDVVARFAKSDSDANQMITWIEFQEAVLRGDL